MTKIKSCAQLKSSIKVMEAERADGLLRLKEQFHSTTKRFTPVNLIRSTLRDISSSPGLADNIAITAVGWIAGFLSRQIITGRSDNTCRKDLGVMVQTEVTNAIIKNPKAVKAFGEYIVYNLFCTKK